jgi:hypothetical protein
MDNRRWWNQYQQRFAVSFSKSLVSIQDNKWKMIFDVYDENRMEIYDLTKDSGEKNNIASKAIPVQINLMARLQSVFGFNLKGLSWSWRERFE